jgi:PAS domain S-box-containing protein
MPMDKSDLGKTKAQLMAELAALRQRLAAAEDQLKGIGKNHRQTRSSLLAERNRAQMYLDIAGVILVVINVAGEITLINKKGCRVLGYETNELIGKNWFKYCLPPRDSDGVFAAFQQLIKGEIETLEYYENPVLTSSGEERLIAWHNTLLRNEKGELVGSLSSGEDVTERKAAEEKLMVSLKEKELLLKEVHHRVKNNMAIISSLLNLQADSFNDPAVLAAFKDSQYRIRSMALVHEKLYQSKDLSKINFSEYIQDLTNQVSRSNEFRERNITPKVEADDINMTIDVAIPCGLIISELLTNAFKYAFPHGNNGEILVRMRFLPGESCELIVRDNGVGLPQHTNLKKPSTFGLNLVNLLTQQLGGVLKVRRRKGTPGTTFKITFPA